MDISVVVRDHLGCAFVRKRFQIHEHLVREVNVSRFLFLFPELCSVGRLMLLQVFEEVTRDKKYSKPDARIVVFEKSMTYLSTCPERCLLELGIAGSCRS